MKMKTEDIDFGVEAMNNPEMSGPKWYRFTQYDKSGEDNKSYFLILSYGEFKKISDWIRHDKCEGWYSLKAHWSNAPMKKAENEIDLLVKYDPESYVKIGKIRELPFSYFTQVNDIFFNGNFFINN